MKTIGWTILLMSLLLPAYGQVELIVRPHDQAADLQEVLRNPASKAAESIPDLLEGVQSTTPVFGPSQEGSKRQATIPAFVLHLPDSTAFQTLEARWSARDDVEYVQPNHYFELDAVPSTARSPMTLSDPLADSLGHLDVIRAPEAWAVTAGDSTVRIGIVDTGVLLDHPDLAGQIGVNPDETVNGRDSDGNGFVDDVTGYDFVDRPEEVEAGDFAERDNDPSPDPRGPAAGHGTAVAGVMSAARNNGEGIAGVAPGTRLVPLRAFGGDGRGATDDIAAAIVYAADMELDVVNLSFGRDYAAPLLREAVRYAVNRGTVVVASGGNNGGDEPHYPSDYPEVISAAWLNADGTDVAFRGEFGVGIDLGAPGSAVYTTLKPPADPSDDLSETERFYGRRSGSSMAAPMISGTAALLCSLDPSLTPASVRSILTASAVDLQEPGWDHRTAAGRLDVAAALKRALPARTEITVPANDGGTATQSTPIIGSSVDPSFRSYSLFYAEGAEDLDEQVDPWTRITGPVERQAYRDTLATWNTGALDEDLYTLRLVTTLRSGRTVEDRRRVYVDRSPPALTTHVLDAGLVDGTHGIVADIETDDPTTLDMQVRLGGRAQTITSEVFNPRHGVNWPDDRGGGGRAQVQITATNPSGLTAELDTTIRIPVSRMNPTLFEDQPLDVPHGFLLPNPTDFDSDGLQEIVFNKYENGALGDTLVAYEWDGAGFSRVGGLVANVIPRDVGDSNGNDRQELLTQVGGATLLLEQAEGQAFPGEAIFQDTTGLRQPNDPDAVWGARLTDLDGDGRGEILSHNQRQWRLHEFDGTDYQVVAELENPTDSLGADPAIDANRFQEPEVLVDDLDGDGRQNLLVGDSDGDWIIYEAVGDNRFEVAWTYETDRINAGTRFAKGDFDGDGDIDFVTYTENLKILTDDDRREPPLGLYYFWETTGDDQYELVRRLPVAGNVSTNGSLAAADFDGDGRDEVALAQPPDLYMLEGSEEGWRPIFRHGPDRPGASGIRSVAMVTADVDGSGTPSIIAGAADQTFHRFAFRQMVAERPPPRWTEAFALNQDSVALVWQASMADSITVFQGDLTGPIDPRITTADSSVTLLEADRQRYALRAWYAGEPSPLSDERMVRPHPPATVTQVDYPDASSVQLRFSEQLQSDLHPTQFALDDETPPASLLQGQGGRAVTLAFDTPPDPRQTTVAWTNVRDAEGTPVEQTAVEVTFPEPAGPSLIIDAWTIVDGQRVELTFSAPLDPSAARTLDNYRITPQGHIAGAEFVTDAPRRVTLEVAGTALGAVGRNVALHVEEMRGASGEQLASEGATVRLVEPASSLDDVYVYPNPYRADRHGESVTVAGLPAEATVRIVSPQGTLVRVLEEDDRDGGVGWDLTDRRGQRVPAGVYLVQVEAPDHNPVLKKAAIVR